MQALTQEDASHFVHRVIEEAIEKKATDIHFEPLEKIYQTRLRIDGLLYPIRSIEKDMAASISSHLKIISHLDIAEKRLPQDGRYQWQSIDIRTSTCPTTHGEKLVLRLLYNKKNDLSIESLHFDKKQRQAFKQAVLKPQGLILVTGPTGSGKTVTLYTALNALKTEKKNIASVEDPVEIQLDHVNQTQVNLKAKLTFPIVMRAFLRQDPDIMMLGEIRDNETASMAIRAAQTGHLLLSTLHTNSAIETITRLMHMGVPYYYLASSLALITAQRLLRELCDSCKISVEPDAFTQHLWKIKQKSIYQANGCEHCLDGYQGRFAIHEVLPISATLSEMILAQKNEKTLLFQAQKEGFKTLREKAIEAVNAGKTSAEEIQRVVG